MKKTLLIISGMVVAVGAQAQLYNNAIPAGLTAEGLRTGPRAAGGSYSEVQAGNTTAGFTANATFRLADDFVVTGAGWNVTSVNFFGYQTGATTATINGGAAEIRTGSETGSVVGTLTFGGSVFTDIYRIFNATPGDTRRVQMTTFNYSGPTLGAGSYWLTFNHTSTLSTSGPFHPSLTKVGATTTPGANAKQWSGTAWGGITDLGSAQPQDLPFYVNGQAVPEPATMAVLGLGAAALLRRRNKKA